MKRKVKEKNMQKKISYNIKNDGIKAVQERREN